MSCNCNKAKPLPSCLAQLIIGEVADTGADYYAVLKTPDGHTDIYDAVNVYGTALFAIDDITVRTGTNYELWLTLKDAANIEEKTLLTIGETTEIECINIEFYQAFEPDKDNKVFETQTITLE